MAVQKIQDIKKFGNSHYVLVPYKTMKILNKEEGNNLLITYGDAKDD